LGGDDTAMVIARWLIMPTLMSQDDLSLTSSNSRSTVRIR
jgi:hypothetical protein